MRTRADVGPIVAALGLAAAAMVVSAWAYRPLFSDSAIWLLMLLTRDALIWDHQLYRLFDAVVQIPTLLLARMAGPRDWTPAIILTWGLSYNFQHLVSLGLCWRICRRANARNVFLFAVLSFASATLMTLPTAAGVVPTSLAVFWPLFLYFWLGKPSRRWRVIALLGAVCLALTHEAAFVLFGVLLVIAVIQRERLFIVVFAFGAVWLAYRGMIEGYRLSQNFRTSLGAPWGPFSWAVTTSVFGCICCLHLTTTRKFRGHHVPVLSMSWILAMIVFSAVVNSHPWAFASIHCSYFSRVLALPLAAVLALAAFRFGLRTGSHWRALSWYVALILFQGGTYDLITTGRWNIGMRHLREALRGKTPKCRLLSSAEFDYGFRDAGLTPWYLPPTSLLIQGRHPDHIVAVLPYTIETQKVDFCAEVSKGRMPMFSNSIRLTGRKYMDFSRLMDPAQN